MIIEERLLDGSGLELLEVAYETKKRVPTMLLTGYPSSATANRAFSLGVYYCEKPTEPELLRRFVAEVAEPGTLRVTHGIETWAPRYRLTSAEARVLRLAALGHSHDEIAASGETDSSNPRPRIIVEDWRWFAGARGIATSS